MPRITITDNPVSGEVIHSATMAALIGNQQSDEAVLDADATAIAALPTISYVTTYVTSALAAVTVDGGTP